MALDDHANPNSHPFDAKGYALTTNILLTITFFLLFLIILLIFLHFYARWYLRRARLRHRQRRRSYLVFYVDDSVPSDAPTSVGLDPSVIQSLPVFIYSAHSDPVECAVCLSDFEENESGRVLPRCSHTFHVECIDMWFQSHSTCPLCRSLVEPVGDQCVRTGFEFRMSSGWTRR
ncbi:RING-H2 finger protein ATL2-like [Neltuma alba]|uniref:RING-H2 finger protein ATL2-like n=1 Tax=Neltuma alba TaxID=207710 RepID=UPI0010A2F068|nr:RING-H2 finger protein ATL2-like [Prosopis alba]